MNRRTRHAIHTSHTSHYCPSAVQKILHYSGDSGRRSARCIWTDPAAAAAYAVRRADTRLSQWIAARMHRSTWTAPSMWPLRRCLGVWQRTVEGILLTIRRAIGRQRAAAVLREIVRVAGRPRFAHAASRAKRARIRKANEGIRKALAANERWVRVGGKWVLLSREEYAMEAINRVETDA